MVLFCSVDDFFSVTLSNECNLRWLHQTNKMYLLTKQPVKTEWWGAGVVICLERGADLHMAQLMSLPLTVSCFSKSQIGLPFWYRLTRIVLDKGPGCVLLTKRQAGKNVSEMTYFVSRVI